MKNQFTRLLMLMVISTAFLGLNRTNAQVLIHYWSIGPGSAGNTKGGPKFYAPWFKSGATAINSTNAAVTAYTSVEKTVSAMSHVTASYSTIDTNKARIVMCYRYNKLSSSYKTYWDTTAPGGTGNLKNSAYAGEGLRLRNPSDSVGLLIYMPTTGYKNIKFTYEVSNSSYKSGVPAVTYAYSIDSGKTWKTTIFTSGYLKRTSTDWTGTYSTSDNTRDTIPDDGSSEWTVKTLDFTNDTSVNNKPGFVLRILTQHNSCGSCGLNTTTSGNLRLDNFSLEGTPSTIFASVNSVQTSTICLTSSTSAQDSLVMSFGPVSYHSGKNFSVQISNASGSFASSTNIGSFAANSTGTQTIKFTVPAGVYSPTGTYFVRVLCPGIDTSKAYSISNISYSPQDVPTASVTSTALYNSGSVTWGTPGGCNYDKIMVVVSPNATKTAPTGTSYTANTIYGSGSSVGSGKVVYYGTTANSSVTITNLKNDSTYYVTVYTVYAGVWTGGVQTTLTPTPYVTMHYWNFNNSSLWTAATAVVPSALNPIRATYSVIDTGITTISYNPIKTLTTSYKTHYTTATGSTVNSRFSSVAGTALSVYNPSDSMQLIAAMPTTGYKRLKVSFARQTSSSSPTSLSYSYSTDGGKTWKTSGMSTSSETITTTFTSSAVITFTDTTVNDNPNFQFRIVTGNTNTGTTGHYQLDNFNMDGVYYGTSRKLTTISKLQNGSACVTKVISGKDSIYFTYYPKTSVPKGTTFTAQISDTFGSFAAPVNIGTVNSDTSGAQVIVATIPAATHYARNNFVRIVSTVDTSANHLLSNIVYSPAPISSLSGTPGNNNAYINWGCSRWLLL